jgi:AcrR family transcriptional regulator
LEAHGRRPGRRVTDNPTTNRSGDAIESEPKGARRQRRGERTRLKIKQALISQLNEQDYFDLTITDICRVAQVATGGFYFHYAKKADLLDEVIREHSAAFWTALDAALHYLDPYSALFRAYRDAPGLVRCFNQLAMADRAYVDLWETAAANWVSHLVEKLKAAEEGDKAVLSEANAYSLLSFVDLLLFKIYIERDSGLVDCAGGVDEVIENVAVLWHRALIGGSPPDGRLTFATQNKGV